MSHRNNVIRSYIEQWGWRPAVRLLVTVTVMLASSSLRADDFVYDTMSMITQRAYDAADPNVLGQTGDSRLADDILIEGPLDVRIAGVEAAFLSFFGARPSAATLRIHAHDLDHERPVEPAIYEEQIDDDRLTTSPFIDQVFGLMGLRLAIKDLAIDLPPGRYWISVQPHDGLLDQYQVRDRDLHVGVDTHVRDGDRGGSYGHVDWRAAGDVGLGAGAAAMRIVGEFLGFHLCSPVPGIAGQRNTLRVTGATPEGRVWFVGGRKAGGREIPGCSGVEVEIADPLVLGVVMADDAGLADLDRFVPNALRGIEIRYQAVDESSCAVSNVVVFICA